jgi:DNA-binding MarR family transcriptional regulator
MQGESPVSLEVLKKFRIIYGSVRQHFHEVEKNCGISGSQVWLLNEISRAPGIGVSELAVRLSIHQSTCSQLVDKLVGRGLVVKARSQEDMRRVGLTLSEAGSEVLRSAPGPAEGVLPEALQALPEDTLRDLDRLLVDVISQLRERDEQLAGKPMADM